LSGLLKIEHYEMYDDGMADNLIRLARKLREIAIYGHRQKK
jgi:hypothetical protein